MATMTIEIPEEMKAHVDQRIAAGEFADPSSYLQDLIARDLRRDKVDRMLQEALDEFDRGEFTVWKKGDTRKLAEEIIERHRASQK